MRKAVTWTAVIVGSLGAAVACSSKSSGGNGFVGGEDASNENEDGGGSSSGGSSGGSSSSSCSNPLAEVSLLGVTLPSTCEPCLKTQCNDGGSWAACETESCTTCATPLISCAEGVCSSACTPAAPEGGSTSDSGGSTSDSGGSTSDAASGGCPSGYTCTTSGGSGVGTCTQGSTPAICSGTGACSNPPGGTCTGASSSTFNMGVCVLGCVQ